MYDLKILHRDLKPENLLLHFPNHELHLASKEEFRNFLRNLDLLNEPFILKIGDFGFAKKLNDGYNDFTET